MKSTTDNIVEFLKNNPSKHVAAELEKMLFRSSKGTYASPKAIRNRLQDAAREPNAMLDVSYDEKGLAWYSIKDAHRKKIYEYEPVWENGRVVKMRQIVRIV